MAIRMLFWDDQVIAFLKKGDEIQVQCLRGSSYPKPAVRTSRGNGRSNREVSILFLIIAGNRLSADPDPAAQELARYLPRVLAVTEPAAADRPWAMVAAERIAHILGDDTREFDFVGAGPLRDDGRLRRILGEAGPVVVHDRAVVVVEVVDRPGLGLEVPSRVDLTGRRRTVL